MKKIIKESCLKAIFVTIFFTIVHQLYYIELVRENIEDFGFDITNKYVFENIEQNTTSPKVMLFGFDDLYMKEKGLFDNENNTNYGYLFPRSYIADFIRDLDELSGEVDSKHIPKALFIDYDFSFTSLPFGKILAQEDQQLIDTLKKDRPYVILLAKNNHNNFIEQSKDNKIQQLIRDKKIVFVSVKVLASSDDIARRYLAYKDYKNGTENYTYPNANMALWQLSRENRIDIDILKDNFKERDIVSNRIFLKSYKEENIEDGCKTSSSYWNNYSKYSASCSLFEIDEEDFSKAIILLGGTYSRNSDEFHILDVNADKTIKGIELHANTIMSIFYLNGQLKQIDKWNSVLLVFFIYFSVDVLVSFLLKLKVLDNEKLHLILVFALMTSLMILISLYLLLSKGIWFNWFVPLILYQIYDIVFYLKMKLDKYKLRDTNEKITS